MTSKGTPSKPKIVYYDIETTGLRHENPDIRFIVVAVDDQPPKVVKKLPEDGDIYVGHNTNMFDNPILETHGLWSPPFEKVADTFLLASMYKPEPEWSDFRLGALARYYKLPFEKVELDFDAEQGLSDKELKKRGLVDVEITRALYKALLPMMKKRKIEVLHPWHTLENEFAYYAGRCEARGVKVDTMKLMENQAEIEEVMKVASKKFLAFAEKEIPVTDEALNRLLSYYDLQTMDGFVCREDCGVLLVRFADLNISSDTQIKQWLLANGWEPTEHTNKGMPSLSGDVRERLKLDRGAEVPYLEWQAVQKVRKMINRVSENLRDGGTLGCGGNPVGALSGRVTHKVLANVPNDPRCRNMFVPRKGYKMVGMDLSGIEVRVLAHLTKPLDDGTYAEYALEGDFHQKTADGVGVTRSKAKGINFATVYGARLNKMKELLKTDNDREAKKVLRFVNSKCPAQERLIKQLERKRRKIGDRWYLQTLDGSKGLTGRDMLMRKSYAVLNNYIQSGACRIFKVWAVLVEQAIERQGIDAHLTIHYHDELQYECAPKDVKRLEKAKNKALEKTTRLFKICVPLASDYLVGDSWQETH